MHAPTSLVFTVCDKGSNLVLLLMLYSHTGVLSHQPVFAFSHSRLKTAILWKQRKHWALRPQKPLRLIRDGEVGGSGIFISNTYSLHCHHQNDSAFRLGSCVSHFNVSLIVWAKSQDSVRKPQFLKRKESRSGSNQGPSAYQPSALPLGRTGSQ